MRYLLDTNVCIKFLNGRSLSIKDAILAKNPGEIVLCSIVKAELFYGAIKSSRPAENLERHNQFVTPFESFPFDDLAADVYSRIRSDLEKLGKPIGPNDLLIASIAVANNLVLVSNNTEEFGRIPTLQLEDWEKTTER
jgi:tRNA(fMet)-specific endonuclease VapC